jgi:hypothetical protein
VRDAATVTPLTLAPKTSEDWLRHYAVRAYAPPAALRNSPADCSISSLRILYSSAL